MLTMADQKLLGKGGINRTNKVPSASAPVLIQIKQIKSAKCMEKETVSDKHLLKDL